MPSGPVVVIETGQRTWRVRYQYLSLRPLLEQVAPVNYWRQFSFVSRMPDGRAALVEGQVAGTPRPGEPGRLAVCLDRIC